MYIITESKDPVYDILLVQEPWWEKINHKYRTVSFPGWQTILPKCPIQTTEHPRVAAYQRINANLEITLCNNIISDLDVMALNIKREGDPREATRIINIYNQKQLGEHPSITYTSNHIENLQWDPNIPTIITGNWNMRHPQWDNGVSMACPRTHETLEWLDGNGFTLCNKPYVPTREDLMGHASVIDLTFKNPAANGGNIIRKIYVDTSIGTLSDHHAIILQVGDPGHTVLNPTSNKLNWKHANEEEFKQTLKELLEENGPEHNQIVSECHKPRSVCHMSHFCDRF